MPNTEIRPAVYNGTKVLRDTVVVGIEQFPRQYVDVVVNDDAKDMLPRSLQYLASEQYIAGSCMFTVPLESAPERKVLVPYESGRLLPVAEGVIPYGEIVGGVVTAKGTWLSGAKGQQMKELVKKERDPWGFFGNKDAKREQVVSSVLLQHYFRSALTLGYAVFDTDKLRQWLVDRWTGVKHARRLIERGLSLVARDGQDPAQVFRVSGVIERMSAHTHDTYWYTSPQGKKRGWFHAANLFLEQARKFPHAFKALVDGKDAVQPTTAMLQKLRSRKPLGEADISYLSLLYAGCVAQNIRAIRNAVVHVEELFPSQTLDVWQIVHLKDIDLSHITQDFEAALVPEFGNQKNRLDGVEKEYMDRMRDNHIYLMDMARSVLTRGAYNAESSSFFQRREDREFNSMVFQAVTSRTGTKYSTSSECGSTQR